MARASHPVRGAWNEIILSNKVHILHTRRTPSGVRGLKLSSRDDTEIAGQSHPVRGAWIEISFMPPLWGS